MFQGSHRQKGRLGRRVGWEKEIPAAGTLPAGSQVSLTLEKAVLPGSKDLSVEKKWETYFLNTFSINKPINYVYTH